MADEALGMPGHALFDPGFEGCRADQFRLVVLVTRGALEFDFDVIVKTGVIGVRESVAELRFDDLRVRESAHAFPKLHFGLFSVADQAHGRIHAADH